MAEKQQQTFIPVQQTMHPDPHNGYLAAPPVAPPLQNPEWSHSFWDCCSPAGTCMLSQIHPQSKKDPKLINNPGFFGCCLPWCLYGKTQSRLEDPALRNYSYFNSDVRPPLHSSPPSLNHKSPPLTQNSAACTLS